MYVSGFSCTPVASISVINWCFLGTDVSRCSHIVDYSFSCLTGVNSSLNRDPCEKSWLLGKVNLSSWIFIVELYSGQSIRVMWMSLTAETWRHMEVTFSRWFFPFFLIPKLSTNSSFSFNLIDLERVMTSAYVRLKKCHDVVQHSG